MPKVVTANELTSGAVVFLGADGGWVASLAQAARFDDDAAAEQGLERAQRDAALGVVEPYLSTVGADRDERQGMSLRDAIRAFGPTVRFGPGVAGPDGDPV